MTIAVTHRPEFLRYIIELDGERAGFVQYSDDPGVRIFTHTEIDKSHEGRGLASRLVTEAVDDAIASGLEIAATCPYVLAWLERHPEYSCPRAAGAPPRTPRRGLIQTGFPSRVFAMRRSSPLPLPEQPP